MKRSFRMITLKQILPQICPGDWLMSLDLKDAYFHIQVAPPITDDSWDSQLKGWHINTRSCRLGCPWLPALLHDAWMRLSPLCDKWESGPVAGGFNIAQDPPPQPLSLPGAQGQLCQEHTVTQPTSSFLGTVIDSVQMTATVSAERAILNSAPRSLLQGRWTAHSLKAFQRMLPSKSEPIPPEASWAWSSGLSISDIVRRLAGPRRLHLQGFTAWMSRLAGQNPFCLRSNLSGSLDQHCSSPSLLGLSKTI